MALLAFERNLREVSAVSAIGARRPGATQTEFQAKQFTDESMAVPLMDAFSPNGIVTVGILLTDVFWVTWGVTLGILEGLREIPQTNSRLSPLKTVEIEGREP
jgi:hypothetical protein